MLWFRRRLSLLVALSLIHCLSLPAAAESPDPSWVRKQTGVDASLRGLCVVDAKTVWASGTGGTVLVTGDAGRTWRNVSVEGAGEPDFRDVHAFDANRAVIISSGQPARIYQTADGGKHWQMRYQHPSKESFFDAISFWDTQHGIVMSDPVDDRVLLIETKDGGATWKELPPKRRPPRERGEAGFAASGTNMATISDHVYIALGGGEEGQHEVASRIVYSTDRAQTWHVSAVPIPRGPSSGVFSVAFADIGNGVAVGGDYKQPDSSKGNIAITRDGGKTWTVPTGKPPRGFRSGVAAREMGDLIVWVAVGTSGADFSLDGGQNWQPVSDQGFHAVQFSPDASSGFASGADGRLAEWTGN